ncbi:MAG: hypothetical protein ACREEA_08360 [Stellaceae bacterium]
MALNFMVASSAKESNAFNPFAGGNADANREMLVSLLGENQEVANSVFRGRAVALVGQSGSQSGRSNTPSFALGSRIISKRH